MEIQSSGHFAHSFRFDYKYKESDAEEKVFHWIFLGGAPSWYNCRNVHTMKTRIGKFISEGRSSSVSSCPGDVFSIKDFQFTLDDPLLINDRRPRVHVYWLSTAVTCKAALYQTMFEIFQSHLRSPTSRDKWNTHRLELQISFMDGDILSHASRVYFSSFKWVFFVLFTSSCLISCWR